MAGRFMKIKKIIIPVLTAIILTSQLTGCASVPSNVMLEMLNQGQDIEITMAVPDYKTTSIGETQALSDIQLDQLQTYAEFRGEFDTLFGIKPIQLTNFESKSGCIYVNERGEQEGNTSFMDSLRNKVFMEKYMASSEIQAKIEALSEKAYTDVTDDEAYSIYAALNAYYNLLSDSTKGEDEYFNANQSVTRGDFYSFVYRASNPVNNLLKTQGDFKAKVGTQEDSALYASQVDQYAWLNADNGGLRKGNYNASISRAEAVYMLMNIYFADDLKAIDVKGISLTDATDGGDMLEDGIPDKKISDQLYTQNKGSDEKIMADGWQLGVISKMLKSDDGTVRTELYKALGLANKLGIIKNETRYNEPISKAETIEMFIVVMQALNKQDGYTTEVALGDASMFIFKSDEEIAGVEGESNLDESGEVITEVEGKTPGGMVDQNKPDNNTGTTGGNTSGNTDTTKPSTPDTSKPSTPSTSKPSGGNGNTGTSSKPTPPVPNNGKDWSDADDEVGGSIDDIINAGKDQDGGGSWDDVGQGGFDPVQ